MDDDNEILDWGNEDDEQNLPVSITNDTDADDAVSLGDESEVESPPASTQGRANDDDASQTTTTTTAVETERPRTPAPPERSQHTEDSYRPKTDSPGRTTKTTPGRITHALPPKPAALPDVPLSTTAKATSMKGTSGRRGSDTPTLAAKSLASTTDNVLPPDWETRSSSRKETYYWNRMTKETSWDHPTMHSSSTSNSRGPPRGGESGRAPTSSPTLSKRPLSPPPHRAPSRRDEPSKRAVDVLTHDDRYYRPGENERLSAREPRSSSRRDEPRLTAADTSSSSRDYPHSSSRGRLNEAPLSDSRREPVSSRRGRDPEPPSRHQRQFDEPDFGSSHPPPVRSARYEDNRDDGWARHSDRSDARRAEPALPYHSSQNESVAAPRRRLSGSPPPAQRHPASYNDRRDDRYDTLAEPPQDSRGREKASRFGPAVSSLRAEDPPPRRREYEDSSKVIQPPTDTRVPPRDLGGYSGEVIYSTGGRKRTPSPTGYRSREDDPRIRSASNPAFGRMILTGHGEYRSQQDNGYSNDRRRPDFERQDSNGAVITSRMVGSASVNGPSTAGSTTSSSRTTHRPRDFEDDHRARDARPSRGRRDNRPPQMDIDDGPPPRRDDPPPGRYQGAGRPGDGSPPPNAPKWGRRARSPIRDGPPRMEVDRSRPREPARPEPPLRSEPRRSRRGGGDPQLASGTNNIPIKTDRYASNQQKVSPIEGAPPPLERPVEIGDREVGIERAREPLSAGKESFERVPIPDRDEFPRTSEPYRTARRSPPQAFDRRIDDARPPLQLVDGRNSYRDEPRGPPPPRDDRYNGSLREDRNGASYRGGDANGYDRRADDRYRIAAPSRDQYPRDEPPRPISPSNHRRPDSPPRRERSPLPVDWDGDRALRVDRQEEPRPRTSRPPLSPTRSRTSHSGPPRMVHPLPANPMLANNDQIQHDPAGEREPWQFPSRGQFGNPSRSPSVNRDPTKSVYPDDSRPRDVPLNGYAREQEHMDVDGPKMSFNPGDSLIQRTNSSLLERLGGGAEKDSYAVPLRDRMAEVPPTSVGMKRDYAALGDDPRDDMKRKRRGGRRNPGGKR